MKRFKIRISGYGSEITIGHVTDEVKELIRERHYDGESLESVIDDVEIINTHWSEIDDVFHNTNVNDDFNLEVIDVKENEVIYDISSDDLKFGDYDILQHEDFEETHTHLINDELVVCCVTGEKGTFFDGNVELESFDLNKLKIKVMMDIQIDNYYHGNMVYDVIYDGEVVYNKGGDTQGKSFNVYMNV
jgi:hypothetical protein